MGGLRVLDLHGQTFGRLTVLSLGGKTGSGGYKWLVRCKCGTEKEVASDHLVRGEQPVRSCGCLRNDKVRRRHNPDQTAFNLLFASYKKRAKGKARDFALSSDEFTLLTQSNCHYCGNPPQTEAYNKPKSGKYVHNGIDRVDPSIGYIASNCVPCCKLCNYMKLALTEGEFINHVHAISDFQRGRANG